MLGIEPHLDRMAAADLKKRRNKEIDRQDRIFNAKVRTIGIDRSALDYQVMERKNKEQNEADTLRAYAADVVGNDRLVCLLERRQRKNQRQLEGAIVQFRRNFQQPESRREFDLNDPALLKKQDGSLMLPGLLGEDPGSKERRRRQHEQLREWSLQQQLELQTAKHQYRLADQQYEHRRIVLDRRALELQKIEEGQRRALAVATKEFNVVKAAQTAERRQQERRQEEEDNWMDIQNHLQGEPLNEHPGQEGSALGTRCRRPCSYKGMRPDELRHIRQCQRQQAEDRTTARLEEQRKEEEEAARQRALARTALLLERQQARLRKQLRCTLDHANTQLASAQQAQRRYLEKEVYTNAPDDGYFAQFNTSSR